MSYDGAGSGRDGVRQGTLDADGHGPLDSLADQTATAADSLRPFDRLDLSQRVGALQLMPENGANVLRLELAASVLATLPATLGLARISTRRWRRWLEAAPFGDRRVRSAEDPACNPFSETVVFFGGSYTVLPGMAERSASLLQMLLRAIFQGDGSSVTFSRGFARSAQDLALAALTLSNECAAKAGLRRDQRGATLPAYEIVDPTGERLVRLRDAVTFPSETLAAQLAGLGVDVEALAPLTMDAGAARVAAISLDDLPVFRRPILRIGDNYVLLAPGSLPAALTHAILSKASECGDLPVVAQRFRDTALQSVDHALNRLGCSRIDGPRASNDPAFPATRALYSIDSDKVLELLLLTDPLEDFDPATIYGNWTHGELSERVAEEIRGFEVRMATSGTPPNGALALVALASPGRSVLLGLGEFSFARPLLMAATDLEVISHTEPGHSLLLWQYAKASDRLRESARVLSYDPLDEFAVWREHEFSYYMSDDSKPTFLVVPPGSAIKMRTEARDALDIHGVPAADGRGMVEVIRYDKPDVPIYAPRPGPHGNFSLTVEGLPLTLWVEAVRTPDAPRFRELTRGLADLVAYWIWQFEPHLRGSLERLANWFDPIVIEVDCVESEAWFAEDVSSRDTLEVTRTTRGLRLKFSEGTSALLRGGDNAGEREIVRRLVEALHDLGRDAIGAERRPAEDSTSEALDRYAPLGLKKKFYFLGGEASIILDDGDLPPYRRLQPAVLDEWRDREQVLLDRLNLTAGPIEREQRVPTLNRMVAESFKRFEQAVAALNPDGLLETLIALGERLIQTDEHRRRLVPAQIACFGTVPQMVEEMQRSGPVLATTAVAHRFVTEYIVARPPSGLRPFSLEAYDELIALAALLSAWGLDSDVIKYGLADTRLTVLESGRLGRNRTEYEEAVEGYAGRALAEQITRSSAAFSAMFPSPTDPAPDPPIPTSELDAATRAEFGISMTQIAEFTEALLDVGAEQSGATKCLPLAEAREGVTSALGWSDVEIDAAFSLLTLKPRADFLEPPPGFERRDLYPWAFNRRLSYLARPLLLKQGGDGVPQLLWGTRALFRANEYLIRQLTGGHVRARTDPMRALQGRISNQSGEDFNDRVAEAYEAVPRLKVRRRVTSIAGRRIERRPGESLGDIDVLVADPSSKELFLVETKDFSAARTPAEFANEEKKLHKTLRTHGERSSWLRANLRGALTWLDFHDSRPDDWEVKQLVVVGGEAFTPGLRSLPVPVITFANLQDELARVAGAAHA